MNLLTHREHSLLFQSMAVSTHIIVQVSLSYIDKFVPRQYLCHLAYSSLTDFNPDKDLQFDINYNSFRGRMRKEMMIVDYKF